MTKWVKRSVGCYPIQFADTVILACETGEPVRLAVKGTAEAAQVELTRFHEWRYNLRESGREDNRGYSIEKNYRIASKVETSEIDGQLWYEIFVSIKPKLFGTLHAMNAKLMEEIDG